MSCCCKCHEIPPEKIEKKRVDLTFEKDKVDAHGYAIIKTVYWLGGSLTCMIGFESDKKD